MTTITTCGHAGARSGGGDPRDPGRTTDRPRRGRLTRGAVVGLVVVALLALAVVLAAVGTSASGDGRPPTVPSVDGGRFGSADTLERLAG